MSRRWAIRLARSSASAAGSLRLRTSVEVHEANDGLWLRGDHDVQDLTGEVRKLPAEGRYTVSAGDELTALGARVPLGTLPAGPWVSLAEWMSLEPQTAALAGVVSRPVPLRLVRSHLACEPNVLLTAIDRWHDHAIRTPQIRLEPLFFAMTADGQVVVRGRPAPSLAGTRYVEEQGIAVPCGWAITPPVGAAVIRELLALQENDLALLSEGADGEQLSVEQITTDCFVKASRASARLSCKGYRDGSA